MLKAFTWELDQGEGGVPDRRGPKSVQRVPHSGRKFEEGRGSRPCQQAAANG